MKTGAQLIAEERERQISQEGWTVEGDDGYKSNQLVDAAMFYLEASEHHGKFVNVPGIEVFGNLHWPWDRVWFKPGLEVGGEVHDITCLKKAGALIAAEIDRILRAHAAEMEAKQAAWEAGRDGVC